MPRWEHGKKCKRQGKGYGKAQHTDNGSKQAACCAYLDKQEANDGARTRKTDKTEGECHEEDAQDASCLFGLAVNGCAPRGGKGQFKSPQKTEPEDKQQQEEQDVEYGIGAHCIQGAGSEEQSNEHS